MPKTAWGEVGDMKKENEKLSELEKIVLEVLRTKQGKNGVICLHEVYCQQIVLDELIVRRITDDLIYRGELYKVSPNHVKVV